MESHISVAVSADECLTGECGSRASLLAHASFVPAGGVSGAGFIAQNDTCPSRASPKRTAFVAPERAASQSALCLQPPVRPVEHTAHKPLAGFGARQGESGEEKMNLCSVEAFRVGEGVCPSFVRRRMQSWFYSLESEHGEHSAEPSSREEPNPSSLPSLPFLIREVAAFWFLKSKGLRNGGASCGALGWPLATWESEPLPHALRSCANSGEKASSEFKTFSPKCRGGRSAADEGGKGRVAGGSGGEGLGAEEVVAQAFFGKLQEEDAASAAFSSQTRLSSAYPMTALACLVTTALRLQTLATSAPSKHLPDGPSFGEALAASQRFSCEETADAFQTNPALQQTATACEQEEPKGPSEGNMLSAGGLLLQALEDESARAEAQLLRCFAVVQEAGFLSDFRRAAAGASSARVRNTLCTAQAVKRFASLPHFPPCDCEVWQKEETPSFQTSDDDILTLRRDSACSALRKFRLCLRQRQSALRASGGLLQASEGGAPVESQLSPKPREEEAAHSSARPGAAVSPSQRSAKEACAERGMTKPSHEALSAAAKFESLKRRRQDDLGKGTERLPAEGKPQFRKSPSVGGARTPSAKHEASLCLERSAAVVTRAVFAFCLGSLSRLPPPHLLLWQRMWTRRRSQEQAELHRAASSPLRLLSEDDCPLRDGTAAPTPAGALSQETTLPHPSAKKPLFKVAAGGALVKPEAASEATAQRRESLVLRLQRSPTALGMKAALRARGAREKSETREEEQVPSSRRGPAVVRLVARGVKRQKLQEEPTPDAATGADRSARGRWTSAETLAFVRAVNSEGVGQWRAIARLYGEQLGRRSNRQLKDKWLNLLAHRHVAEQTPGGGRWVLVGE